MRVRSVVGRTVDVIALINSGYETSTPELLIPRDVAKDLGLYPSIPVESEVKEYVLADGSRRTLIRIPNAIEVSVVTDDRIVGPIKASVVIAEHAEEPLISDKLSDALGIVALAIGQGLWCFKDELGRKTRKTIV